MPGPARTKYDWRHRWRELEIVSGHRRTKSESARMSVILLESTRDFVLREMYRGGYLCGSAELEMQSRGRGSDEVDGPGHSTASAWT